EAWSPIPLTPAKKREADCDEGLPFVCASFPVAMERGKHPFPSRTRKLSPSSPMVLHGRPCGRVGRCRSQFPRPPSADGQIPKPPRTHVLGGFSFFAAVSPPPDSEPSAGGWTEQRERSLADASFAPAPDGQTFCRGRSAAKRPAWTQDGPHCVNVCRSLEASAFASAKRRGESGVQAGAARAVRYRSRAA